MYIRICAAVFICCSILMPVILDLIMPFNVTREALIQDKINEMSYEKAVEAGLDMSRDEADLDKLLDAVFTIDLREEQENLIRQSAPQTGTRTLDEIFNVFLNRLYENATAIGFEINIDNVSAEKNGSEIKRTVVRKLYENANSNISKSIYDNIDITQLVLNTAYKKARGIIEDKVYKNARKTASKDISSAQVIGTITENVKKMTVPVAIAFIAGIIGQISGVIISVIGAQKSKICVYIMMAGYALGIIFYIFFPLAGMDFSTFNTSFPMIISTISIPGEIAKYIFPDLLLRIIALIALYKFKRVKYDTYGRE